MRMAAFLTSSLSLLAQVLRGRLRHLVVLMLVLCAACGTAEEEAEGGPAEEAGQEEEEDYQVFLGNALADTLQGDAQFGLVVHTETGEETFVIELVTGYDFAGGFFVARGGNQKPAPGTYPLTALSDSVKGVPAGQYVVIYRQGMLRDLVSRAGTVTFSTVSDTLIEGTLDATLHGFLTSSRGWLTDAEVRARGQFRARPGAPGYIIGL
jgi:hypothetical protein